VPTGEGPRPTTLSGSSGEVAGDGPRPKSKVVCLPPSSSSSERPDHANVIVLGNAPASRSMLAMACPVLKPAADSPLISAERFQQLTAVRTILEGTATELATKRINGNSAL